MRYIYITALVGFKINERMKEPILIKHGVHLTNNPAHTAAYIKSSQLVTVGFLEAELLTDGSPVLYKLDEVETPTDAHVELVNFLREVQGFLTATWLHEDNAANCELGFAFSREIDHVHSNALALNYRDHAGARRPMEVNLTAVCDIAEMHERIFDGLREENRPKHTAFQKSINRLDRAMRFLTQARSSDDVGQRIANFCSYFECLLSTSANELSHQLSERAAFFLADTPTDRLKVFREMKRAYGVRSKIVHGDILSASAVDALVETSRNCDDAARALLLKIIADTEIVQLLNEGSNEALDRYMLDLIFGITTAAPISSSTNSAG